MFYCLQCGRQLLIKKVNKSHFGKYCSNACQGSYEALQLFISWKHGETVGYNGKTKQLKPWLRRYILFINDYACNKCGWNKRHPVDDLPLVEVNHIDGDAANCNEENLEVLCPNCHSETINFRARNKISTRNRKSTPN